MATRHPFDPGPAVLVAHRCDEHRGLAPVNNQASMLVTYAAEMVPKAYALGRGSNHEEIHAECGGCLAEEVEGLYQQLLDTLDVMADALTARAEMRRELERSRKFGL